MLGKKAKKALKLLLSLTDDERDAIVNELGDVGDDDEKETVEVEESGENTQVEATETTETETGSDENATETKDAGEVAEITEESTSEEAAAPEESQAETEEAAAVEDENSSEPDARIGALESAIKEIKETLKPLAARMGDEASGEKATEEFGIGAASSDNGMLPEKKFDAVLKKYFGNI